MTAELPGRIGATDVAENSLSAVVRNQVLRKCSIEVPASGPALPSCTAPAALDRGDRMSARRRTLIALGAAALAPLAAFAQQQSTPVFRIGFLGTESAAALANSVEALRTGLRDLGYVEGKNLMIEYRWADGRRNRIAELAAELLRLDVDVIVTNSTSTAAMAGDVTATIPIVMTTAGDAIFPGVLADFTQQGRNAAGRTVFYRELVAKRLELIKEAFPRTRRVAVLVSGNNSVSAPMLDAAATAAEFLALEIELFEAHGAGELAGVFAAMAKQRVDAVMVIEDPMLNACRAEIADLAVKHRLPSAGCVEFAEAGGLISYGPDFSELWRRAGNAVDKILRGGKPADIAVEEARKFNVVINMKTARTLGIGVLDPMLKRASRVIA